MDVLVTAGTGKTGRRVVERLVALGHQARAASRHPAAGVGDGVRFVEFDWDLAESWGPALAGADAAYVVLPALRADASDLLHRFLGDAHHAGVGRVVLLTARGVDRWVGSPLQVAEVRLRASGLEWGIVRPSWFMQNYTEGAFAPPVLAEGELLGAAGTGAAPFVDADDIAAVAAAILTGQAPLNTSYDVTGPEALTHRRVAELLSEAIGRTVTYVDVPPGEWRDAARRLPVDDAYGAVLGGLFEGIRAGTENHTSDGVERALGRAPTPFEAFAERHRAAVAKAPA